MIGKFAIASVLMLLIVLGEQGLAQTAPAAQPPAEQAPAAQNPATPVPAVQQPASGQEPADETSTSRRKKPHDYNNWSFNVGGGANVDSGSTRNFVRNGGGVGEAGVARNANKYFGLRADFIFADLPLRDSTQQLAQASGATSYALSLMVGPVINVPVTKEYGGYILFGPGYIRRAGHLDSDNAVPGSACNSFWTWWGSCTNTAIPLSGSFVNSSQNDFGYNLGAGISRKMPSGVEIYAEYRLLHGSSNGVTTDFRPITIGFRW